MNTEKKESNTDNEITKLGQIIDDSELETIAGGGEAGVASDSGDCYFMPEIPTVYKKEHGVMWVKCKSTCKEWATCACYGKIRCVDRWHRMEHIAGSIWAPLEVSRNNHTAANKAVRDIY